MRLNSWILLVRMGLHSKIFSKTVYIPKTDVIIFISTNKQLDLKMKAETGMFSMDDVRTVLQMELDDAKKHCMVIIGQAENIRKENIQKAKKMVEKAKNSTMLGLGISNFILAHGELKVIK